MHNSVEGMKTQDLTNETVEISWSVNPLSGSPWKAILFWLILAFIIWAFHWNVALDFQLHESLLYTFLVTVLLLAYLSQVYLTTHFKVNADGGEYRRWFYRRQMPWSRVRSVIDDHAKLLLSPFPVRSRLEKYRGMHLVYRGNRSEVIRVVRHYNPDAAGLPPVDPNREQPAEAPQEKD